MGDNSPIRAPILATYHCLVIIAVYFRAATSSKVPGRNTARSNVYFKCAIGSNNFHGNKFAKMLIANAQTPRRIFFVALFGPILEINFNFNVEAFASPHHFECKIENDLNHRFNIYCLPRNAMLRNNIIDENNWKTP